MAGKARKNDPPKSAFDSADPVRNFTLSVNDRIRAMTIGAPAFATRKKRIEDMGEAHVETLLVLHETLTAKGHDPRAVHGALQDAAASLDMKRMNELVVNHNRYYPIEANLPTNLRGEYLIYGRPWHPEPPWTAERVLALALAELSEDDDA